MHKPVESALSPFGTCRAHSRSLVLRPKGVILVDISSQTRVCSCYEDRYCAAMLSCFAAQSMPQPSGKLLRAPWFHTMLLRRPFNFNRPLGKIMSVCFYEMIMWRQHRGCEILRCVYFVHVVMCPSSFVYADWSDTGLEAGAIRATWCHPRWCLFWVSCYTKQALASCTWRGQWTLDTGSACFQSISLKETVHLRKIWFFLISFKYDFGLNWSEHKINIY